EMRSLREWNCSSIGRSKWRRAFSRSISRTLMDLRVSRVFAIGAFQLRVPQLSRSDPLPTRAIGAIQYALPGIRSRRIPAEDWNSREVSSNDSTSVAIQQAQRCQTEFPTGHPKTSSGGQWGRLLQVDASK